MLARVLPGCRLSFVKYIPQAGASFEDSSVNRREFHARTTICEALRIHRVGDSYEKAGWLTKLFVNTFIAGPVADKNIQEESVRR